MKTIRISIYAMMLLLGASCVKEEQQTIPPMAENTDVPSFMAVGSPVSRVSLSENGTSVRWAVGDVVAVTDGSGDIYRFASEGDGTNAIFRYMSAGEVECMFNKSAGKYLMAYPWTPSVTIDVATNTVTSSLPAVQNAVKGNFDGANAVAVAVGNDLETPFAFKCAVSMLKVTVPEDLTIAELAVRGNQDENIVGDLVISCTEDGPVTTLGERTYPEVRLISENGILEPGTYYIAIAPVTVSKGISVVAVSTGSFAEFEISTAKSEKTFMPGYIYDLGTLNADKIEFADGGVGRLPYVFPFFATAGTGNIPKYISTSGMTSGGAKLPLTDDTTAARFEAKVNGADALYWSNKWYGQDNVMAKGFTTQESAGSSHKESYFMLTVPLRMSLPQTFRVSFGFFVDGTNNDIIKEWKMQYSKDMQSWYDGATYEIPRMLKYHSFEITPEEVTFGAGDNLYLRWIPVGSASWNGGTTTGLGGQLHLASGVAITDVTSPDSDAYGNVYAEDFDRINGGVDYRHAGQADGIEKLGLLGEIFGEKIENWSDEQKNGLSGSYVAERPGYVQIGYATYVGDDRGVSPTSDKITKYVGSLVTPALERASGTINLSFKAMCYRSPFIGRSGMSAAAQEDVTDIVVNIRGAGSFSPSLSVTSMTLNDISTNKFDTKTLVIYNSDATTQVEFTSTAVSGKFTRWFLDDICISELK